MTNKIRRAVVKGDPETIDRYLPSNYSIVAQTPDGLVIEGYDVAGWTLDDYVIPRLASGLHFAHEIEGE